MSELNTEPGVIFLFSLE